MQKLKLGLTIFGLILSPS